MPSRRLARATCSAGTSDHNSQPNDSWLYRRTTVMSRSANTARSELLRFPRTSQVYAQMQALSEAAESSDSLKLDDPGLAPKTAWWERAFQDCIGAPCLREDVFARAKHGEGECVAALVEFWNIVVSDGSSTPPRFAPGVGLILAMSRLKHLSVPDNRTHLCVDTVGANSSQAP